MNEEKIKNEAASPRVFQQKKKTEVAQMEDNRDTAIKQSGLTASIQRMDEEEDELLQGKFETTQRLEEDEEELLQGKFKTVQRQTDPNQTGIPDEVKDKMEDSFGTDFSDVRVHPDSSKAPEVGALAYTQGSDIHFAPGQFKPDTSEGQQLLGHELTHVIQQAEGRVQPTTEVNGMAVNDNESLEHEADVMGGKAING